MTVPIVDQNGQVVPDLFGGGDIANAISRVVEDRFIGANQSASGNNTNANIGELAWNCAQSSSSGTWTRVTSIAGHMGIGALDGNATLGGHEAIYLGHAAVSGSLIDLEAVEYFEFEARNIGAGRFRFGIGNDAAAPGLGTQSIVVSADNDIQDFWYCAVSGQPLVLTTVPIDTIFRVWRIAFARVSATQTVVQFSADGELVASFASFPPLSTLMAPAVQAVTITPGPFQGRGQVDTFRMKLRD